MFDSRLLILSATLWMAVFLAPAGADSITRMIRDVQDTAEQEFAGNHDPGLVRKGSSDLELGMEGAEDYTRELDIPQRVALLYRNIDIPSGATIDDVRIQFMVDEPDKTTWFPLNDPFIGDLMPLETSVTFYGYLNANATDLPPGTACDPFGNCINEYGLTDLTGGTSEPNTGVGSGIANVTEPIHWDNIPTWTTGPPDYEAINGTAGPDQLSPNLAAIVQEIINLPDWTASPDNAIVFFIDPKVLGEDPDTGLDIISRGNRTAINFCTPSESRCVGATAPQAPVLTIDFTSPADALPDYNGDGIVNAADYPVWRNGGSPDSSIAGYDLWKAHFGEMVSNSSSQTTIPEPATAYLFIGLAALGMISRLDRIC